MKKTIVTLLAIFWAVWAIGQGVTPPAAALSHISMTFNDPEEVRWDHEGGRYEAMWKENGRWMGSAYAEDGTHLVTSREVIESELPEEMLSKMNESYPGAPFLDGRKRENADGSIRYQVEVKVGTDAKMLILDLPAPVKSED